MTMQEEPPEPPEVVVQERDEGAGPALLLAAAAILAALFAGRASLLSGSASSEWQRALRTEVQRTAARSEDIRYIYIDEGLPVFDAVLARTRSIELLRTAGNYKGLIRKALIIESETEKGYADSVESAIGAADERYRLEGGGFDMAKRFGDSLAENPDLLALDPDVHQRDGDAYSEKASAMIASTIPIAIAFLLSAAGKSFPAWRRRFISLGAFFLVAGVVFAVFVEVTL